MSTHWGIHCNTCNTGYVDFVQGNHREDDFEEMIANRGLIVDVAKMGRRVSASNLCMAGLTIGPLDVPVDLDFFLQHENCDLAVVNEYGDYNRECGAWLFCDKCNEWARCDARASVDPGRHRHYSTHTKDLCVHFLTDGPKWPWWLADLARETL